MANYTEILFTEIGPKIKLLANDVPVVLLTKYPKLTVFKIQKINLSDVGKPFETIKYKAFKNELESNISMIQVNLKVDEILPEGNDINLEVLNGDALVFSDHIILNDGADRIIIKTFAENVGLFEFKNTSVYPDQVIMKYDLNKLAFRASNNGVGNPYQSFKYIAANKDLQSLTENTFNLNIVGLTSLQLFSYSASQSENYFIRTASVILKNGVVNSIVKIKVSIDLTDAWPINNSNEILFSSSLITKTYKANGEDEFLIQTDGNGDAIFQYSIIMEQFGPVGITGTIKTKILEINGATDNILLTEDEVIIEMTTNPTDPDDGPLGPRNPKLEPLLPNEY